MILTSSMSRYRMKERGNWDIINKRNRKVIEHTTTRKVVVLGGR